ncbi:MAG: lipoyl synthase [Bacteroidales bacterium]|jgi:lipoic acid synthetase|nr:lipoyl synthase [Bacteroidales bacterium]
MKISRKPDWLKIKIENTENFAFVKKIVTNNHLHTICSSGKCPNLCECWSRGTATFMIMGDVCTRTCRFCATKSGKPLPLDNSEPERVAESVFLMKLKHCVITSVDRDDLPDKGAAHWAETIRKIRKKNPNIIIELLIPDYQNELLQIVIDSKPDIIGHNLETVERLTPVIRSKATYQNSLETLRQIAVFGILTKTGIMVGLGETEEEVFQTLAEARNSGTSIVTIGQYLQPAKNNLEVVQYITPAQFEKYKKYALKLGYKHVESAPLVRSSYMSDKVKKFMQFTDWQTIDYKQAWNKQEALFQEIIQAKSEGKDTRGLETVFLCEHPHVYTLGKNGQVNNLLISEEFLRKIDAVFYRIDRGGDITYHGPGQLVGYPILDLENHERSLKGYIHNMEEAIIQTLAFFGIESARLDGATGVWLDGNSKTARKICAIGVRASRFVTMHGFALNVNTDLSYFNYINPCGFLDKGVTSMQKELGKTINMQEVKEVLRRCWFKI